MHNSYFVFFIFCNFCVFSIYIYFVHLLLRYARWLDEMVRPGGHTSQLNETLRQVTWTRDDSLAQSEGAPLACTVTVQAFIEASYVSVSFSVSSKRLSVW